MVSGIVALKPTTIPRLILTPGSSTSTDGRLYLTLGSPLPNIITSTRASERRYGRTRYESRGKQEASAGIADTDASVVGFGLF